MKWLMLCLVACLFATPAFAQNGRWVTASGNLVIDIAPCGDALCGTAVRELANHSMSDTNATISGPSPIGLKILRDFTPSSDKTWYGQIYNRENGKTYRCKMTVLSADELEIHPYVGIPLFGQTQVWHRATDTADSK
ncbi:MAG TPA: DUF2147 domain-containing protein [Candidatus Binataceae bacterium]|nr:DUF2147 domain-containing protein [Candidatus Binataceae bacterium]